MKPDPGLPGTRRLGYSILLWLNRHPLVWRGAGALLRRWPFLGAAIRWIARRDAVSRMLHRPESFQNTSHAPNLVAGEFLIGMNGGERYERDLKLFLQVTPSVEHVTSLSMEEARRRIEMVKVHPDRMFDLVEQYLMWVVHRAAQAAFGAKAQAISGGLPQDDALVRRYLLELRYVAAQLFAGGSAPSDVQQRAEVCAFALRRRIDDAFAEDKPRKWAAAGLTTDATTTRDAVGYAWVSHPVTVQSGALAMRELLGRREVYRALRAGALALGEAVWTDPPFREQVQAYLLELMRFRPVFPVLGRDVPRETMLETGGRRAAHCKAGSSATALTISALFDPATGPFKGSFWPTRPWGKAGQYQDDRYLMFGFGPRQCPGKHHAVAILTSAFIGLLTLPELHWADGWGQRIVYDGPMVSRMRLKF